MCRSLQLRLLVLAVALLASTAAAAARPRQKAGLASPAERIGALRRLGYTAKVAEGMATSYPKIADQVLAMANARGRLPDRDASGKEYYRPGRAGWLPVRVFRGVAEPKFRPTFRSRKYKDAVYVSGRPQVARTYGAKPKNQAEHGLVLEMQLPQFLLRKGNLGYPMMLSSEVPDYLPFVKRVGLVPKGRKVSSISWQPPRATADYATYKRRPPRKARPR